MSWWRSNSSDVPVDVPVLGRLLGRFLGRFLGRLLAVLLWAIAAGFAALLITVSPALAEDDLVVQSEIVFAPQPAVGTLNVSMEFVLTNNRPPLVTDETTEDFFFDDFTFTILTDAEDLVVRSGGQELPTVRSAIEDSVIVEFANVALPERLLFGEVATIDVEYVIPNGQSRSSDAVRISPSYLAFPVYACCDAGQASVRVEIPADFTVTVQGNNDLLTATSSNEARGESPATEMMIFEAADLVDPVGFYAFVFGRNDTGLIATEVDVAGTTVEVLGWPDDVEWSSFVADTVTDHLPSLEELIGEPFATRSVLEVVETSTPYLFGYAGWYDHRNESIELGEQLDRETIVHELAHAWFSDRSFDSRWINEGMAEYFAHQSMLRVDGAEPRVPTANATSWFAIPLNTWERPIGVASPTQDATEQYGYSTSTWVIDRIGSEIGRARLAEVFQIAEAGRITFTGNGEPEIDEQAWRSWQRFLDLVEFEGGWSGVDELFTAWVLTAEEQESLALRSAAHAQYQEFSLTAAPWDAPVGIRSTLTVWDFATAQELMTEATQLLQLREELEERTAALGVLPLSHVGQSWSNASTSQDLQLVRGLLEEQLANVALVERAAVAAERDLGVGELGLQGVDLDQKMAAVRAAWAQNDAGALEARVAQMEAVVEEAPSQGIRTVVLVGVVVLALVFLVWQPMQRRRRRRRRIAGQAQTDDLGPRQHSFADRQTEDHAAQDLRVGQTAASSRSPLDDDPRDITRAGSRS